MDWGNKERVVLLDGCGPGGRRSKQQTERKMCVFVLVCVCVCVCSCTREIVAYFTVSERHKAWNGAERNLVEFVLWTEQTTGTRPFFRELGCFLQMKMKVSFLKNSFLPFSHNLYCSSWVWLPSHSSVGGEGAGQSWVSSRSCLFESQGHSRFSYRFIRYTSMDTASHNSKEINVILSQVTIFMIVDEYNITTQWNLQMQLQIIFIIS